MSGAKMETHVKNVYYCFHDVRLNTMRAEILLVVHNKSILIL